MDVRISTAQFDANTESVIDKVRKLLALANNNDNEHQAQAAANKARELLEAYNLDMAIVDKEHNKYAARDKQTLKGGLYNWQRDLWNQVASLNFCKYWFIKGNLRGTSYEHQLLGSKVNVIAAQIMANYLQETIERLARDWVRENRPGKSVFIKEAIAFREGLASRLVWRMYDLRSTRLREEEAKIKADREANKARGIFTENALVLADVISTEEDLNNDYVYGYEPGTSAQHRRERELRAEKAEIEVERMLREQREWDEAHPEEAAARRRKEEADRERRSQEYARKEANRRPRRMTAEEERRQMGSYRTGYYKGDSVSLDKQMDHKETKRIG